MKILASLITLFMAFPVFAAEVPGQIFYKKKDGNLVKRDVVLEVPARGEGEVVLKAEAFEWKTTDFKSAVMPSGQVIFTATFKTEFMDKKSTILLKGTYIRAENEILYNGNFYKKKGHDSMNTSLEDYKYGGGFTFNYLR